MIASLRWIAPLTALGFVALSLVVARPDWLRPASASHSPSVLLVPPSDKSHVIQARLSAKSNVVDRFLDGELTLLEAAAWFRELNDTPPHLTCDFRSQWPGNSDGEKVCRQVIYWAKARCYARLTPSEADEIIRRMEDELSLLLCEKGTIELPW